MTLYNILNRENALALLTTKQLVIFTNNDCVEIELYDEKIADISFNEISDFIYANDRQLFDEISYLEDGERDIDERYYECINTKDYIQVSPIINFYLEEVTKKGILC